MPTGRIDMIIAILIVVLFAMMSSPSQVNKSWCRRIEKPREFEALTPGWCICGTHYLCRCNPDCKEDTDEDICSDDEVKLCSNSGKTVLEKKAFKKKSFQKEKGGPQKREGHRSLWSGKGLSARGQHQQQHSQVRPNPRQVELQLRVHLPVTNTTTMTPRPLQLHQQRRSLRQGNLPETGAQREEVCICLKEMVSRLEKYTKQLRNLNMMPEYHDAFEITRLAERTTGFNLNQNHEVIINDETRDEIEAFKRDVTKPSGGMRSYIDLLLKLLIGKSWTKIQSRNIGKDLYGQVKGLCDEGVNGGLMALAVEGVKLYDFAMNLNIPEVTYKNEIWRESLAYRFAKAEGAFYKGCGCPKGSLSGKYNEVSKLLPKLGIPTQTYKEANNELIYMQKPEEEKYKARILLQEFPFDVTKKNIRIINDHFYEDIILVQSLIKLKNMTGQTKDRLNLLPQFEKIPICFNLDQYGKTMDCSWGDWSNWSDCKYDCGVRTRQERTRTKRDPNCPGEVESVQDRSCSYKCAPCPSGWIPDKKGLFGCFNFGEKGQTMTWSKAKAYCESLQPPHTKLAEHCSKDMVDGIAEIFTFEPPTKDDAVYDKFSGLGWIGVQRSTSDHNQWKWASDGGILTSADMDWRPREPNDIDRGGEDCVEMVQSNKKDRSRLGHWRSRLGHWRSRLGHWNDKPCFSKRYPICHYPCDSSVNGIN